MSLRFETAKEEVEDVVARVVNSKVYPSQYSAQPDHDGREEGQGLVGRRHGQLVELVR